MKPHSPLKLLKFVSDAEQGTHMKRVKSRLPQIPPLLVITGLVLILILPTMLRVRAAKLEARSLAIPSGARHTGLTQAMPSVCADLSFTPHPGSPFFVGEFPESVIAGDFNSDGKLDLAAANGTSNVTIMLGDGGGGFTPAAGSPVTAGGGAISIAVGDFNGDGKTDLVTANYSGNDVTILLGNGSGGFTQAAGSPFAVGVNPISVAVGDFNVDGKLDLATANFANSGPDSASVLLGNGSGGFTQATGSPFTVGVNPRAVAVGDFNGDGKPDVAVANNVSWNVTILLSDGSGGFTQPAGTPPFVGQGPWSIAVSDFNGDGKLDLVTANIFSDDVMVMLGNGSGGFAKAPGSPIAIGFGPTFVTTGDINGDGIPDLAVALKAVNRLRILLGNGSGGFTTLADSTLDTASPTSIAIADFNQDSKADLAISSSIQFASFVKILLNSCTLVSPPTITPAPVTRTAGSAAANSQIATVNDAQDPPNSLIVTVNGGASATVNGVTVNAISVSTGGLVTADVAATCAATNANFTLRVTDSGSLFNEATLTLTVTPDNQPPTIICPANITKSADANACTAAVTYATPAATDNCSAVGSVTCTPSSGSSFPKGATTVTCSATDASGNSSSCSFTVTIADTQSPTLGACPVNINASSTAGCANVTYTPPTVSDNCPGATVSCAPPSGTCFAIGTTPVTCTGTDTSGNTTMCSFTVTVTPCAINCPANVTAPAGSGLCTAVVSYSAPTTTGSCGTVTCSPPSGSTFSKGTTTVTCSTQTGPSCMFTVTVNDTQPPQITCPPNVTQATDKGQCQAVVSYANATATDNCSGVGTPACSPASGSVFAKGVTTVTCTASDASGNTNSCSFTVTVNDNEAPQIACPANITRPTTAGQCTAVVTYTTPQVTDNCPNVGAVACSPASGTSFAKGVTTVSCTVADASGNTKSCSFTVTVNDTTPPQIACPANISVPTDAGQCAAIVAYTTTATDNCPGLTVACNPPSGASFPKGTTTVACVATDTAGNAASCTFTVTVNDTQPPTIACPPNQTRVAATPGAATVMVTYPAPAFSDNCPGASVACVPPSGSAFPLGTTTVTCLTGDAAGNTTACTFTVTVFDIGLQDDSNPGTVVLVNSLTGQYRFYCGGTVLTGTGSVLRQGSIYTLSHNATDRRVTIRVNGGGSPPSGTASLQAPPGTTSCTITDRDTRNNTCQCP
jgi:hypothetical protein